MKKRVWIVAGVIAAVAVVGVLVDWGWIYDFWRGMTYAPAAEVVEMREKLGLTERGEFLFNAAQPELMGREEFNTHCKTETTESAVLGCYTEGNIYVYDIESEELAGIRELTLAHELLHAVWARMSEGERVELTEALTRVFEGNQEFLEEEINAYDISEKQEELYVRAGTEVKELPERLEEHYAGIFKDQDLIVGFYESYIGVFRKIEQEMKALTREMEQIRAEIDALTAEYEDRVSRLNTEVESFNRCAEVAGCFNGTEEFYTKRGVLVAEQEELSAIYERINGLVESYNAKVEMYNADVMRGNELQKVINSNVEPEGIE